MRVVLVESELPIFDAHGGSLVSFARFDDQGAGGANAVAPPACAMVVVGWDDQVLLGFNVTRQQWEVPGGSLEAGESARDAAIRELTEETGIHVERLSLVARAVFTFAGDVTKFEAEIFTLTLDSAPDLIENEELNNFVWWDPASDVWEGLSRVDAEIVRRCLSVHPNEVT
jgi:8-oxo-dGTP diphosphatase